MVVRNHHGDVHKAALVALSYRCSMARSKLTQLLFVIMVDRKYACHTLANANT